MSNNEGKVRIKDDNPKKPLYIGYARESIDLKSGIAIQVEKIEQYAKAYGIDVPHIFKDNKRSAFSERPDFEQLWSRLDEYDGIIVSSLDRFGRDFNDLLQRLEEMDRKGKILICIRECINSGNDEGKFFLKLLALFAYRERTLIRERLLAGILYAREHGTKSGKGWGRPRIEVDWARYQHWADKGLNVSSIAKIMGLKRSLLYERLAEKDLALKQATK